MNKNFIAVPLLAGFLGISLFSPKAEGVSTQTDFWKYQCLDTMKLSRDLAREWPSENPNYRSEISREVSKIKELGANCIAVGTPYDDEFLPYLSLWVSSAREKGLLVWFRGNFSGWEGWFGYPKLKSIEEHHEKTFKFVTEHPELFRDGDIFTPAPEPENGLIGDPRRSAVRAKLFRDFLAESYDNCEMAFKETGKKVKCGYFSTNGDIAKEILTKDLVEKIGGVVVIDHYVKNPQAYASDIKFLNEKYGAKVFLGEFGAPIPDIHGPFGESEQANFLQDTFEELFKNKDNVQGVNYWVLSGGSTKLLNENRSEREAAKILKKYYKPAVIRGVVTGSLGEKLEGVSIKTESGAMEVITDNRGSFALAPAPSDTKIIIAKEGYETRQEETTMTAGEEITRNFSLVRENPSFFYRLRVIVKSLFK